MKKRLALLLACTMALSLTACGGGKAADPTTTAAPATTAATEAAGEESRKEGEVNVSYAYNKEIPADLMQRILSHRRLKQAEVANAAKKTV